MPPHAPPTPCHSTEGNQGPARQAGGQVKRMQKFHAKQKMCMCGRSCWVAWKSIAGTLLLALESSPKDSARFLEANCFSLR